MGLDLAAEYDGPGGPRPLQQASPEYIERVDALVAKHGVPPSPSLEEIKHQMDRIIEEEHRSMSDTKKTLEAARTLGWHFVLLQPKSKKPAGASWQVTTEPAEIEGHLKRGGNVGLLCEEKSGVAVLDFDDLEAARAMMAAVGPLPITVETGSGKWHCYVKWQAELPAKIEWQGRVIGEVQRGPNQQVVAPPSIHPTTGKPYLWARTAPSAPPPLPEAWLNALKEPTSPRKKTMDETAEDAERARRKARKKLDEEERAARMGVQQPAEDFAAFMARLKDAPPLDWYVPGLIPEEGVCLWHAQPRELKSLCALECDLALASGRAPFNNERFRVRRAVKVAYFTEEDSERLLYARMRWLTAKSGAPAPGMFFPFVRRRLNFDEVGEQEEIIRLLLECGAEFARFDPLRSLTVHADKGPADLAPVAMFLRRVQNETACKALGLLHHDTKPLALSAGNGSVPKDDPLAAVRTRSQQASGGGIFSISDCPVAFKKLDWNRVGVFPEDYKLSGDPVPFIVTFTTDEKTDENGAPAFGTWVVPVAVTKGERAIAAEAVKPKVVQFLKDHAEEWHTTSEVEEGTHTKKGGATKAALEALRAESCVRFAEGSEVGRNARAHCWRWVGEPKQKMLDIPVEVPPDGAMGQM